MSEPERKYQYTESFNAALQWMWGDGYLSPGGPEEVAEMLRGVTVRDRDVVDVGSGLGAIDVSLVATYGARSVLGIDVEPDLIEHASKRAADAGVDEQVRFQLVEPGPLPLEGSACDMVFSKDAIVHIADKQAFYADVLRVLRPGGVFVGSDWLRGGDDTYTQEAKDWLEYIHLNFKMQDLEQTGLALKQAGFEQVQLTDRNEWYKHEIANELAALTGDRYEGLAKLIGAEQAAYRRESSQRKQRVIEIGFLRPTHFVCYKPGQS